MADTLRIHFMDETFRDLPPDTFCNVSEAGLLFTAQDGRLECWYRVDLVHHVDRVPQVHGVTLLPMEAPDGAGRL